MHDDDASIVTNHSDEGPVADPGPVDAPPVPPPEVPIPPPAPPPAPVDTAFGYAVELESDVAEEWGDLYEASNLPVAVEVDTKFHPDGRTKSWRKERWWNSG